MSWVLGAKTRQVLPAGADETPGDLQSCSHVPGVSRGVWAMSGSSEVTDQH